MKNITINGKENTTQEEERMTT